MLIWSPVENWKQVPIGAYISVNPRRNNEPSSYWYNPNVVQCVYTGMSLSDDGTLLTIDYYIVEGKMSSSDQYSMDIETQRAFLYATELPDYDPDQEPEDDCL